MQHVQDNALADLNATICDPTPWNKATSFELRLATNESYRLTINADPSFFSLRSTARVPVDSEILCTAEQATALRILLIQWIHGSR